MQIETASDINICLQVDRFFIPSQQPTFDIDFNEFKRVVSTIFLRKKDVINPSKSYKRKIDAFTQVFQLYDRQVVSTHYS